MIKTLNNIELGFTTKIKSLNCTGSIRRRLLDLGLVKDTYITPLFKSPSRWPCCLWNKRNGYSIACRG